MGGRGLHEEPGVLLRLSEEKTLDLVSASSSIPREMIKCVFFFFFLFVYSFCYVRLSTAMAEEESWQGLSFP